MQGTARWLQQSPQGPQAAVLPSPKCHTSVKRPRAVEQHPDKLWDTQQDRDPSRGQSCKDPWSRTSPGVSSPLCSELHLHPPRHQELTKGQAGWDPEQPGLLEASLPTGVEQEDL